MVYARPQSAVTDRVILIIGNLARSMISFRGHLLAKLLESGNRVHVCVPSLLPAEAARLREIGVEVHVSPLSRKGYNPLRDILYMVSILRLCRRIKADAVLAYTVKPTTLGLIAARLARVPSRYALVTGRGYVFSDSSNTTRRLRIVVSALYRISLAKSDVVFFQNNDDRLVFETLGLLKTARVIEVVNGSGVDTETFAKSAPPPEPVLFLMASRLLIEKGVREFIAACSIVRREYPSALFQLAGGEDVGAGCIPSAEVQRWKSEGIVEILGHLDDVRPALRACHVFVLPSYNEGTPRAVLEALSVGRPVITTDSPGCRETVEHGRNGLLVPARSSKSLAQAMIALIQSHDLRISMGERSREIALRKYDVRLVTTQMLDAMSRQS